MNEKVFYHSRVKLIGYVVFLLLLVLLFGALAVSMVSGNLEMDETLLSLSIIIGVILVPILVLLVKKVLDNKPAVIVSREGIEINGFTPKVGFIPWEDMEGCFPYSLKRNDMIGIVHRQEEEYINTFTGTKRKVLELNRNAGYPAINVVLGHLKDPIGFLYVRKV